MFRNQTFQSAELFGLFHQHSKLFYYPLMQLLIRAFDAHKPPHPTVTTPTTITLNLSQHLLSEPPTAPHITKRPNIKSQHIEPSSNPVSAKAMLSQSQKGKQGVTGQLDIKFRDLNEKIRQSQSERASRSGQRSLIEQFRINQVIVGRKRQKEATIQQNWTVDSLVGSIEIAKLPPQKKAPKQRAREIVSFQDTAFQDSVKQMIDNRLENNILGRLKRRKASRESNLAAPKLFWKELVREKRKLMREIRCPSALSHQELIKHFAATIDVVNQQRRVNSGLWGKERYPAKRQVK